MVGSKVSSSLRGRAGKRGGMESAGKEQRAWNLLQVRPHRLVV